MDAFWPGPLTLVVSTRDGLDGDLGKANGTVALRVPDHATMLALLDLTGPLAVTSANLTGEPPATTALDAERALGAVCAVILDAGPSPIGTSSTVLDVTQPLVRILREGAIGHEAIEAIVGSGAIGAIIGSGGVGEAATA
jgi:tRNA threonylcarbamoyl adenosine modification protein (Sua5/YciO/YrdC/YwlC family)